MDFDGGADARKGLRSRTVSGRIKSPHGHEAAHAPTQTFATAGLAGMVRSSLTHRILMTVVAWVERLNVKCAKLGNPCVYDNALFPWAAEIEREWRTIRRELERVLTRKDDLASFQEISADVAAITRDAGWKTFLFTGYGVSSQRNTALCPETWRIVQRVPGLKTALFSIFEPGKHLPAHRGPYNGVLRLHLGLMVPEPRENAAIRVGRQILHWQEGRVLIFDDAYEHEAWNRTGALRAVLFVDFVRPLRFPANLLNWLLLNVAMFTPFVREGCDNHRKWERRFYA
jgi:ornithine lipid ester-linked acyl 2-hydroxylase